MNTIFQYLDWRGDLNINIAKFNNIDALILARFSYLPFDNIVPREIDKPITIKEAYKLFRKDKDLKDKLILENDYPLFKELAKNERFRNMKLYTYVNDVDEKSEKQFSAITIDTLDNNIFVSFRGTDSTLTGWKEDFNMSFMDVVPAQIESKNYLEKISGNFNLPIRVAGHSKGGNLAIYSSSFTSKKVQDKIKKVYNFDGPGLNPILIKEKGYRNVLDKIHTFLPQSSIVGILLEHEEDYSVIHSYEDGLTQHDIYTWEVMRSDFVYLNKVSSDSVFIDSTIRNWLANVDEEKRSQFFDAIFEIFEIFEINNKTSIDVLNTSWLKAAKIVFSSYKYLDDESKKMISEIFSLLIKSATDNIDLLTPKISIFNKKKD
ncbi:Mbeg1-like protein [Miniphocaeibacter halophilus]|uniref:DUF2974 domain-containing protein n=1 Tax=Miniphocaeibacter halophilus TaxID=2931922 RepID=A0AC61MY43_9FIRM|nr:Mbeg1-like protein [Miniphocaeibacter halophilus]QQK08126.1 DUF2974 domain-containing protein [Miniphocaeibacter halophilus]